MDQGHHLDSDNPDESDRVGLFTITLVFTDTTEAHYQVICLGVGPAFEEAERHFMAVHGDDSVELDHLLMTNHEGITIARWEGVGASA